ncbi:MAG: MBOAT family protein [Acidobacteria bacterium]|nr:MAG: MBOAT family protein [Acidobacteriota bacterium]
MSLAEPAFLLFLVLVALLLRAASGHGRAAPFALLGSSLVFYATWNPVYLLPLAATIAVDFLVGAALGRAEGVGRRRLLLGTSLVVDLSLLVGFKYFDLLAPLAWPLLGEGSAPPFRIVFAAGISFYTFQSLSYVFDVYRREQEPARSFLQYAAYVSFFPTLLAGPITRAETLLPQLARRSYLATDEGVGQGLLLVALGFLKKVAVADVLSVNLVERVFDLPGLFTSLEVLVAVYAYAVQIWADFSGYSDMAIGAALILGFRLKENFRSPYRATDLAEFWRRWHISFSTWLRDYLFFSLPGKRPGTVFPYLNLVVTFGLGGLWHGASWTFAVWGLMHGAGLAAVRLVESRGRRGPRKAPSPARSLLGGLLTFHFVAFSWVFFRSASLSQARDVLAVLFDLRPGLGNVPALVLVATAAGLAAQLLPEGWLGALTRRFVALPVPAQAGLLLAAAAAVRLASGSRPAPFIYFSF